MNAGNRMSNVCSRGNASQKTPSITFQVILYTSPAKKVDWLWLVSVLMTSGYFFLLGTPSDPMPERLKSTNKHSLEWEIILVLLHEHTTILELTASYDSPDRTWLSPHSHIQPFWVCFTSGLALDAFPRKKSRFWILILKSPGVNRGICTHASLTRRVCGGIVYHTDSK